MAHVQSYDHLITRAILSHYLATLAFIVQQSHINARPIARFNAFASQNGRFRSCDRCATTFSYAIISATVYDPNLIFSIARLFGRIWSCANCERALRGLWKHQTFCQYEAFRMNYKENRAGQGHSMPVYGDHYLGVMAFDHIHYALLSSWNTFAEYEIVKNDMFGNLYRTSWRTDKQTTQYILSWDIIISMGALEIKFKVLSFSRGLLHVKLHPKYEHSPTIVFIYWEINISLYTL